MVGLIIPANIKYSPYVLQYLDICRESAVAYELITWNKCGIPETSDHVFQYRLPTEKRGLLYSHRKFLTLISFSCFAKKICRENRYDKLIVFSAALAMLLSGFLTKNYVGRYILDIRDYSPAMERFQTRFLRVVRSASEVVVSSPDFCRWIGGRTAYLSHNAQGKEIEARLDDIPKDFPDKAWRIMSAGALREYGLNAGLLKKLRNDGRFRLLYIGNDTACKQKLKEFAAQIGSDAEFGGPYNKSDIYGICRSRADAANIMRSPGIVNRFALPNKLYESTISGIPVIAMESDVTLARMIREYHLGAILEKVETEGFGDILWSALNVLEYQQFCKGRRRFLDEVLEDQRKFGQIVKEFLLSS